MKTTLDCIPCFYHQALEAAKIATMDATIHERILREVSRWIGDMDPSTPPPFFARRIQRRLQELTGAKDPYRAVKDLQNRMAMGLHPRFKKEIDAADDPLAMALRLAAAGNMIDIAANKDIDEETVLRCIRRALAEPLHGDEGGFRGALETARDILYLADNAGEIVFDRLLIEHIQPSRVTLAVRGFPILNDATEFDARAVGLQEIVRIIGNGSDIPGTVLTECSPEFQKRFASADLVLAKGQGNYETLSNGPSKLFFLFKAKCPVIAEHAGVPLQSHVLVRAREGK